MFCFVLFLYYSCEIHRTGMLQIVFMGVFGKFLTTRGVHGLCLVPCHDAVWNCGAKIASLHYKIGKKKTHNTCTNIPPIQELTNAWGFLVVATRSLAKLMPQTTFLVTQRSIHSCSILLSKM